MTDLNRRRLLYGAGAGAALAITGRSLPARASVKPSTVRPSTAQPNAVTTAAVTTNSKQPVQGWANVRDYGAMGDGGTDDTAAINAAINAVTGNASPAAHTRFPVAGVYLPPGIYKVTRSPICIP